MTAATTPDERWRLGYRPELDGLRGIAIALVLVSHFDGWLAPGVAGVVLFFVLSGFLITSLLLEEHARTGGISLPAFWLRRVRRLGPALAIWLVVVAPLWLWLRPDEPTGLNAISTLFYVANWRHAAVGEEMGVFGGMWSLSIEEQFYLVWPVILARVLIRWPRLVAPTMLAAAVLIVALRFTVADAWLPWFFATPLRLDAIALGCALSAWYVSGRRLKVAWWSAVPFLVVALVMVSLPTLLTLTTTLAAVAGVLLVGAVADDGASWLRWRPLRELGRISYGLYLWHAPVFLLVGDSVPGPVGWALMTVASIAVAMASYRWVERPFLVPQQHPQQVSDRAVPVDQRGVPVGSGHS